MSKLHLIFYGLLALFITIYVLRALLMVGYDHIKFRNKKEYAGQLMKDFFIKLGSLQPIVQRRLEPRGYDYKLYNRFQNKFIVYYAILWACLFVILFLAAKLFLGLF